MIVRIRPQPLRGSVVAGMSKSDAHRKLVAAALADEPTRIEGLEPSEDIDATVDCLTALGARLEKGRMHPVSPVASARMNCRESATTLRMMVPIAAAYGVPSHFSGDEGLQKRPLAPLLEMLSAHGLHVTAKTLPFTMRGCLQAGEYALPGDITSQFVSGMLMAMPKLVSGSMLRLQSPLQSAGYVALTLRVMKQFQLTVFERDGGYAVPGNQTYRTPGVVRLEKDWSNAAFFLAAGAMGGEVTVKGLPMDSAQPDQRVVALLEAFGAEVSVSGGSVTARHAPLHGITVDISQTPDLIMPLAVVGAVAKGRTRLTNAARVRLKESDRLETTCALLRALGGRVETTPDALVIEGCGPLRGGTASAFGDHRLAMAAAAASVACREVVTILGAQSVNKSYPRFFEDFQQVGGRVDVIDDR